VSLRFGDVAVVWLALFLLVAPPAGAATVHLTPASGEAGGQTTLIARGLVPNSGVALFVGRRPVDLVRAGSDGTLIVRERIPRDERGRVRVKLQDERGNRAILRYHVRSRWSGKVSAATGDLEGRVLRVATDLRLGRLVAITRVRGLAPGRRLRASYARTRVGKTTAGDGGRARIRAVLPETAAGRRLVVKGRGVRLAVTIPTPPATIAVAGDIACRPPYETYDGHCQHAETAALTASLRPDAIALPGDIQYDAGRMSEFRRSFGPTWGQLEAPLRPTPGNHEYRTQGAADYFDYFEFQSGWRPPPWYSYNVGPWRLIALNSNCEKGRVDCSSGSEQEEWLRANLAAEPYRCTLAYWHHPRYSSGFHGSDTRTVSLWRILDQAGAEIVLSGHDHHYERFALQDENGQYSDFGMRQFVVGTGGSAPSVVRRPRAPHSEYAQNRHFGVLRLRLYEDTYAWGFIGLNGKLLDSGAAGCL
jgi:hypothetical protein